MSTSTLVVVMLLCASQALAASITVQSQFAITQGTPQSCAVQRKVGTAAYAKVADIPCTNGSWQDTQVTAGQQHCYKVVATNAVGQLTSNESCQTVTQVMVGSITISTVVSVP